MELDKRDLDNYITGHFGEDQFSQDKEDENAYPDCGKKFKEETCPYCSFCKVVWD